MMPCRLLLAAAPLLVLLQGLQGLPASAQETPPAAPPVPPVTATTPAPATPAPAPGDATAAPATPPAVPAVPVPERVEFTLKFPEDQGGGSATGKVVSIEYKGDDYAVLSGSVELHYQDLVLHADKAEIDLETRLITATGSVILDQGPRRLTGETAKFDLKTKTGTLSEATGQVSPDYYFQGREVAKIAEDTYTVTDGTFTSCNQKTPDWSFRLGTARVEVEGYAHVRHASLRAKKLPVFYTPYILWPVKSDRTSGFLIPNIGYSDRRGAELGFAYFQTLGRSYDTTFHVDTYSQGYLGLGNEFRYRPTERTAGNFIGYTIRDPEALEGEDEWRWKVEWNHATTDLPWNMRGVVQIRDYSDFNFFRDFEREIDRNTLRFIDSRAFVSGNWGPHLVNFLLNDRETFISFDQTVEQKKLPELEYRLRSTRLWKTPLYGQFQGSASFLDINRDNSYSGSYGRVDLFPQLSLPIRAFPWLSVSVTGGGRLTYYGDTIENTPTGQQFAGETLSRTLPTGNADVVGPSFSRIWNRKLGGFGKFKHVIEPRFTYSYLGDFDEFPSIPIFDEVDFVQSTNQGRLALSNRVLAKTADEKGIAREIFLFELARAYSFDKDQPLQTSFDATRTTQDGPFEALLRFNPSEVVTVRAEATYATLFSGLSSTSLSSNFKLGKGNNAGLTWFTRYQPEIGETVGDQIRVFGGVDLLSRRRLRLEAQINYDLEASLLQQQRYILNWNAQCYSIRLELRDFRATAGPSLRDKDFRFSLSLKNVGTFLDLTSRSSNDPQ